jgi:tyrosine-protein kinase Etk/Wzc
MEKDKNLLTPSIEGIDFEKLIIILRKNLIWIIAISIFTTFLSYLYLRYTKNIYRSDSELKLEVKKEATVFRIDGYAEEENLNLISGEIEQIKSRYFLSQVIDSLDLKVSYYVQGKVLNDELYKRSPFYVEYSIQSNSLSDIPVFVNFENDQSYQLRIGENVESYEGILNEPLHLGHTDLTIRKTFSFENIHDENYYFIINSKGSLLSYFLQNIDIVPLNFNANTIQISFRDFNSRKAHDIVNKIDSLYLSYSYEQKNLANKQKIDWLNKELTQVEKKMENFEDYFEDFTIKNKSNDVEQDLRRTIELIRKVDSQRYEINKKLIALNALTEALTTNNPISIQKQFLPGQLTGKVDEFLKMEQERNRLSLSYNEKTFAFKQKEREFDNLKKVIFLQLSDLKKEWLESSFELSKKKEQLEREFATMPDKSTQLAKNKRFYKLYEEFYLSMMQSKAEFEIAKAGSIPDFKILSLATYPKTPISPRRSMILGIGLMAGLIINFFFIGFLYLANNKITSVQEVERSVSAPLLGVIPISNHNVISPFHILDNPKSMVSESIRILRTNLDFFTTGGDKKIISISSTISGEGKSFLALNLGGILALSKKKVILLDLDMRKNKEDLPFKVEATDRGISTSLIKKHKWKECVVGTSLENFDYLPSGPHPPNPSELLLNGEFSDMLQEMKAVYDYIVIDTPPVGLVTDGIMAMKRSDLSIYVLRSNYSKKDFLNNLKRIISINKLEHVAVVLNAMPSSRKTYGYGYYEDKTAVKKRWKNLFHL